MIFCILKEMFEKARKKKQKKVNKGANARPAIRPTLVESRYRCVEYKLTPRVGIVPQHQRCFASDNGLWLKAISYIFRGDTYANSHDFFGGGHAAAGGLCGPQCR
jgi:hypothetical protein